VGAMELGLGLCSPLLPPPLLWGWGAYKPPTGESVHLPHPSTPSLSDLPTTSGGGAVALWQCSLFQPAWALQEPASRRLLGRGCQPGLMEHKHAQEHKHAHVHTQVLKLRAAAATAAAHHCCVAAAAVAACHAEGNWLGEAFGARLPACTERQGLHPCHMPDPGQEHLALTAPRPKGQSWRATQPKFPGASSTRPAGSSGGTPSLSHILLPQPGQLH
jgi:hypothetical protein